VRDSQFQIAHLLLGTTLVAMALALGRLVLPPGEIRLPHLDRELFVLLPAIAISNLAITIPGNWAAFARWPLASLFGVVGSLYVIVLSIAEVFVLNMIFGKSPDDVWWLVSMFNWTQFATVFATLLLLRGLGFELLRRTRKPSPTGALHLGNAKTFLLAWLSVRVRGGPWCCGSKTWTDRV
jgi:hypothetical protein